ncbi:MAG: hypothetical protein U0931_34025 [Vulcanimicrobiota bacterium]
MTLCLDEYLAAAAAQPVVPCWCEMPADLETPLSVFLKLRQPGPAYLLESVERGEVVGRYSILGTSPTPLLRCFGDQVETPEGEFQARERARRAGLAAPVDGPMRQVKAGDCRPFGGAPWAF